MALFSDLVPSTDVVVPSTGTPYTWTSSPDAVFLYDPATGTSTLNPDAGASVNRDARRDGSYDELTAQLGGGTTVAPVASRVGPHPTTGTYGANFDKAMYVWMRGGDPSTLTMRAAPTPVIPGTNVSALAPVAGTPVPTAATVPPPAATATPSATPSTTGAPVPSALGGFNTFYNSPTYQVPLAEGLEAVNTKYAAMGALESGAAMKAINDYAAGHAASALSTYMDNLYRQEALGAQSAAALAGVGTNMVSQVSANNNSAANAAGNAALISGQASANNWNNVGSAIGTAAGAIGGALSSSYGGLGQSRYPVVNGVDPLAPLP